MLSRLILKLAYRSSLQSRLLYCRKKRIPYSRPLCRSSRDLCSPLYSSPCSRRLCNSRLYNNSLYSPDNPVSKDNGQQTRMISANSSRCKYLYNSLYNSLCNLLCSLPCSSLCSPVNLVSKDNGRQIRVTSISSSPCSNSPCSSLYSNRRDLFSQYSSRLCSSRDLCSSKDLPSRPDSPVLKDSGQILRVSPCSLYSKREQS